MAPWLPLFHLGDPGLTIPVGAALVPALLAARARRLACWWLILFGAVLATVAASKVAFMSWGIGASGVDFKAISGHATGASAVFPTLFYVLFHQWQRARSDHESARRHRHQQDPRARLGDHRGFGTGLGIAMLVGVMLVAAREHTVAEAAAGCLLGGAASAAAIELGGPLPPPRPLSSLLWFALVFLAAAWLMRSIPTGYWMIKAARVLTGHRSLHQLTIDCAASGHLPSISPFRIPSS